MKNLNLYFARTFLVATLILVSCSTYSQKKNTERKLTTIEYAPFSDNTGHWYSIADKHNVINALPDRPRYKPTEITAIADNMLLFQKNNGGWPKNYDFFAILTPEQKKLVQTSKAETNTTFDKLFELLTGQTSARKEPVHSGQSSAVRSPAPV